MGISAGNVILGSIDTIMSCVFGSIPLEELVFF